MAHRVLVADDLSSEGVEILRRAGLEVDVRVGMKPEELEAAIGDYDAIAVRSATKVTARVLEKASRLRVVGRAGVGVDNVDLDAATRRGVVVMNTPGGSSVTVAELAVGMMLALSRHIAQATVSIKAGKWEKKRFQGHELSGKTLGVVGIGNIGSVVVDRARSMKMSVVAYDPFISAEAAAQLGVELVTLDELWARADVISLHVPLTEQTRNVVNAATLARMKKGVLLVNCARGGLVDEKALADALASGHVGGAALDVFEKEPVSPDNPLLSSGPLHLHPAPGRLHRGGPGRRRGGDRRAAGRVPDAGRGEERRQRPLDVEGGPGALRPVPEALREAGFAGRRRSPPPGCARCG